MGPLKTRTPTKTPANLEKKKVKRTHDQIDIQYIYIPQTKSHTHVQYIHNSTLHMYLSTQGMYVHLHTCFVHVHVQYRRTNKLTIFISI